MKISRIQLLGLIEILSIVMYAATSTYLSQVFNVPKLKAIIFAEFDADKGPVIRIQVPHFLFDAKIFDTFSNAIIPKPELFHRLIKVNHVENSDGKVYKIMGHPVGIESDSYVRGRYIFNVCFVVDKNSQVDCLYEPMVQKCAAYLTLMEKDSRFLSQSQHKLPGLLLNIFESLNEHGECKIPVIDQTTIYLKLCPSFHGIEPPKVEPYMVPMFTQVPPPNTPNHIPKMDVLSQKICPKVDGVRCIKEIAMMVQIDADLVMRCVRNLHFYGCLTLIPLFMYSNTYVATEQLHDFYTNTVLIEECLDFIRPLNNEGKHSGPKPLFSDVFRLYASLKTGMTMKDWCERMSPRQYNVDERRVIQFGVCHGFVRKLCIYPVSLKKGDLRRKEWYRFYKQVISGINFFKFTCRIAKLCDGTRSLEDLAVVFAVSPVKLLEAIRDDGNFVFISK
uniref:Nitrogen permease regulator 2-like protein n=1 Tax=Onchocerca volvulus TaxID=6282 RepID=A0A8R1XST2_ONCVO